MRPAAGPVVLLGSVRVGRGRQGPGACGPREAGEHGQHDPLVAIPPGGVAMAGADRVAMPGLGVGLDAGVGLDGIVADEWNGPVGGDEADDRPAGPAGQPRGGPGGGGGDASGGGRVTGGRRCGGAREVGDGAPAGGEAGRAGRGQEPPGGASGGGGRRRVLERPGLDR